MKTRSRASNGSKKRKEKGASTYGLPVTSEESGCESFAGQQRHHDRLRRDRPEFAAAVANAFAHAYMSTTIELKVEPARQYADWFGTQGKELRDRLEKAQAKLSAYQQEHGIVASDERVGYRDGETQ